MFSFYANLVTIVLNLSLGILVFFRNSKNKINRNFFSFMLWIVAWIWSLFLLYHPDWNVFPLLELGRFNYLAGVGAAYSLYLMARVFPLNVGSKKMEYLDWIVGLESVALALITMFTPLIDSAEEIVDGILRTTYGSLFMWFVIHFLGLIIVAVIILIKKYKYLSQGQKFQTRLLFIGFMVTVVFAAGTNLLIPLIWGYTGLQEVGPFGTVIMASLIGYSIIWHKLLDVTALVARAVSYFLLLVVVVSVEAVFVWGLTKVLPVETDRVIVAMVGAVIIVFSFDWVRKLITDLTEKIFFRGRYDTEEVLARLTKIMASVIDIKLLSQKLLKILVVEMRITRGAFVLLQDNKKINVEAVNWQQSRKLRDESLVQLIYADQNQYIFEDLKDERVKQIFRELGVTVAMPLVTNKGEIGLLLLGPKSSGDIYSKQDLELLNIFSPQVSVAMSNAQSYQEIQEFSRTLEKRVAERTRELKEVQKKELIKAQELLRIKDEFVFVASHDLATPVTAVSGYVDLIMRDEKLLPKRVVENLNSVKEASQRLNELVDDLLQVARSESGSMKVEVGKVDLIEVVESVVNIVKPSAKKAKVKIRIEMDKKNKYVKADREKLAEVVENLLTNAIKYNKERGEVVVESTLKGKKIIMNVKDTGIGIPEKEHGKVFTKFFRSEDGLVRLHSGTGLGLFVVRMLVEKMGGKVGFSSKEGVGTNFFFELDKG